MLEPSSATPTPARTGPDQGREVLDALHERVRRDERLLAHEIRDRRVARRAGRTRPRSPPRPRARRSRRASGRTGAPRTSRRRRGRRGSSSACAASGRSAGRSAMPRTTLGTSSQNEQDADPPGGARLVVDRDPDREERRPGAERGDEPGQEKIAVPAVFGHTDDRELRGELPQHPGRAYNLRRTASAVRNGRARAVEWRRWPAARGLTTNSSPACERATGEPSRGRSRWSRTAIRALWQLRPGALPGDRLGRSRSGSPGRPGVGKSSLIGALDHARPRARPHGRGDLGRSLEPLHARSAARRPDPARPTTSSTRASSSARWAPAGISAGWPRRRCSPCLLLDAAGHGRRLPRDRRSGSERGRGDGRRRRGRARPDAGLGRLGAGAEGRDHGDPGRDRDQQDGSAGGEGAA